MYTFRLDTDTQRAQNNCFQTPKNIERKIKINNRNKINLKIKNEYLYFVYIFM
jgi:hypothetical protein